MLQKQQQQHDRLSSRCQRNSNKLHCGSKKRANFGGL